MPRDGLATAYAVAAARAMTPRAATTKNIARQKRAQSSDLRSTLARRAIQTVHVRILQAMLATLAVCELWGLADVLPSPGRIGMAGVLRLPFFAPAMLGAFAAQLLLRPRRNEIFCSAALAAVLFFPAHAAIAGDRLAVLNALSSALGGATIAVLAVQALRTREEDRENVLAALLPALILAGFVMLTSPLLHLTAALWPTTYDAHLFLADAAFGRPLSFDVTRLAGRVPLLLPLCLGVYVALPLALIVVHALRRREQVGAPDTLTAFVTVTVIGYLGFLITPVAGPLYAFLEVFPSQPPFDLSAERMLVQPFPRNCLPSLHSAWALLIWWNSHSLARPVRAAVGLFVAVTLLATVALGFHYVCDLVAAFPLTLAVQAWTAHSANTRLRQVAILAGLAMTAAWMALVTGGVRLLQITPVLPWLLSGSVVAISLYLQRRLRAAEHDAAAGAPKAVRWLWTERAVALLALLSGFATMQCAVVTGRSLEITFGNDPDGRFVMLAAFLAAMAAGALAGDAVAARLRNPLRSFAVVQLGGAIWCWSLPIALSAVQSLLVATAGGFAQLELFATIVLLGPPAIVAGAGVSLLLVYFRERDESRQVTLLLFALFAGGAAVAPLCAAYVLLPVIGSLPLIGGVHVVVSAVSMLVARRWFSQVEVCAQNAPSQTHHRLVTVLLIAATGVSAAFVDIIYVHLLAVVAGDSIYTRASAAFSSLIGICVGASLARWRVRSLRMGAADLSAVAAGFVVAVLVTSGLWNSIPGYFGSFAEYIERYQMATILADRETVRLFVCSAVLFPPTLFAGALFGLSAVALQTNVRSTVWVFAGAAAGGLAAGWLISVLGSSTAIRVATVPIAVCATLLALLRVPRRLLVAAAPVIAGTAVFLFAPNLDLSRLASPSGVYFDTRALGEVIDHVERAGVLTTVHRSDSGSDLTLAVNGQPVGDTDDVHTLAPHLIAAAVHSTGRSRALVIGAGTGAAARILREMGFARLDIVERNVEIRRIAEQHFAQVHAGVFDDRSVVLHDAGVRVLLLGPNRFDLVSIAAPPVESATANSYYSRELYQLARGRLSQDGVVHQQIRLHHLSVIDLAAVLAAVRSVFEHVWVYAIGNRASIVACVRTCPPGDPQELANRESALAQAAPAIVTALVLDPAATDRLLNLTVDQLRISVEALATTDSNLFLAHHAPHGTALRYDSSLQQNLDFLRRGTKPTVSFDHFSPSFSPIGRFGG